MKKKNKNKSKNENETKNTKIRGRLRGKRGGGRTCDWADVSYMLRSKSLS